IARRSSGSSAFTVASVPTAMNAGECTTPCGVANRAARAAPLVVSRVKSNGFISCSQDVDSDDGHRVAVRIEAIAFGDRLTICAHGELVAQEGGDEHDESGAGQVEVGDQRVHNSRTCRGADEDTRLPRAG